MPAASANSDVPIHAPAMPVGSPSAREAKGSRKNHRDRPEHHRGDGYRRILLLCADGARDSDRRGDAAHRATDAERRGERPIETETFRDEEDHAERDQRDDRRLQDRDGLRERDQRQRHRRAKQNNAGLDVELAPETRIEPARQAQQVGADQPEQEREQRRFQVICSRTLPLAHDEDCPSGDVEQSEGGHEPPQSKAQRAERDCEGEQPDAELRQVPRPFGGDVRADLPKIRPFRRRDREPA